MIARLSYADAAEDPRFLFGKNEDGTPVTARQWLDAQSTRVQDALVEAIRGERGMPVGWTDALSASEARIRDLEDTVYRLRSLAKGFLDEPHFASSYEMYEAEELGIIQ